MHCSLAREKRSDPHRSRIRIRRRGERAAFLPHLCLQCVDPLCIKACPSGARGRDPATRLVRVVPSRCIACRACLAACPAGAIWMSPEGEVSLSCDACGGAPACVEGCTTGALRFRKPFASARRILHHAARALFLPAWRAP
ncbi:MAG: 4Fe-4S dicluster domain-containing protein [Planctomycetota bacterium]